MPAFVQIQPTKVIGEQQPDTTSGHIGRKIWVNVHTIESISPHSGDNTRIAFWGLQGHISTAGRGYIIAEGMSNLMKRIEDAGVSCAALPEPEPEPEPKPKKTTTKKTAAAGTAAS